jgi:hypothetical protein
MRNYILILLLFFTSISVSFCQTKADSVMYLSPYVVVGSKSAAIQLNGTYGMYVPKGILTEKVRVAIKNSAGWADYVFDKDYHLKPLSEVASFVRVNKHLPDVPTTEEVKAQGIDLAETQKILLQKIEEMTLYIIEQDKRIKTLEMVVRKRKR